MFVSSDLSLMFLNEESFWSFRVGRQTFKSEYFSTRTISEKKFVKPLNNLYARQKKNYGRRIGCLKQSQRNLFCQDVILT